MLCQARALLVFVRGPTSLMLGVERHLAAAVEATNRNPTHDFSEQAVR